MRSATEIRHDILKKAISETIQEVKEAPSGPIYGLLMGHLDFETYVGIIEELVREKKIHRTPAHLLIWIEE